VTDICLTFITSNPNSTILSEMSRVESHVRYCQLLL